MEELAAMARRALIQSLLKPIGYLVCGFLTI